MRTFVAALVFASVYAQEEETTVADQAEDSWNSVKNWFASSTQEYLTTASKKTPFGSYTRENGCSMESFVSLDFTAIGTNFVTVTMNLSNPDASYFAEKTRGLVYFQIEEPVEDDHAHDEARLLQEETAAAEEPEVTGTGNYEGWFCFARWGADYKVASMNDYQLWGTTLLSSLDKVTAAAPSASGWLDKYGGKATEAKDPWQPSEGEEFNFFRVGEEGAPHVWSSTAWRIASASDVTNLRFKFLNQHDYFGTVGHFHWPASATSTTNFDAANNSGHVKFMLDGATAMTVGLSAAVAALSLF